MCLRFRIIDEDSELNIYDILVIIIGVIFLVSGEKS